ncbi:MAG: ABC transporter ATP-binding protein [Pseudorhodobacter sp.]
MIVAKDIHKSFGATPVLDGVTLTLPSRGITSIIGPNGAGKSTLLAVIARLTGMDAGTVTVDGLDVTRTPSDILARRLSILRQDNHMTARLTVRDLVSFGRYPYTKGRPTEEDRGHILRALDYMGLADLADRFLDELSGGQRQRAYVAMVLCQDTDFILLDEPLNSLDMQHARSMMQTLEHMCRQLGKTVVIVLHDINFASWYSDHIVALKNGRICHQGPTAKIINTETLRGIYNMEIEVMDIRGRKVALFYE